MNIDIPYNNIYNSVYINETSSFEERLKQPLSYRFSWMLDQIKRDKRDQKDIKVIDAGCGKGFFVHKLREAGFIGIGIDNFSETGENKAKEFYKQVKFLCHEADLTNLAHIPDDSSDYVTCSEVIEHMPNPELAIKEFVRILKPNGQLFLTTPIGHNLYDPDHKQFFAYRDIYNLFDKLVGENNSFIILKKNKFFEKDLPNLWAVKLIKGMKRNQLFEEPSYLQYFIMKHLNKGDKILTYKEHSKIMYLDLIDKGCEVKFDCLNGWADTTICFKQMNNMENIQLEISNMVSKTKIGGKIFFYFDSGENLLDKNPISNKVDFYTVADYIEGISSNTKIIRMNKLVKGMNNDIFLVKIE